DDRRRLERRLPKDATEVLFGLAAEGTDDLGPIDVEELRVDLVGHASGQQRLAGPGRSEEDDAPRGANAQLSVDLWKDQRQLDKLPDRADLVVQPTDVFERGVHNRLGVDAACILVPMAGRPVVMIVFELHVHGGVRGYESLAAMHAVDLVGDSSAR